MRHTQKCVPYYNAACNQNESECFVIIFFAPGLLVIRLPQAHVKQLLTNKKPRLITALVELLPCFPVDCKASSASRLERLVNLIYEAGKEPREIQAPLRRKSRLVEASEASLRWKSWLVVKPLKPVFSLEKLVSWSRWSQSDKFAVCLFTDRLLDGAVWLAVRLFDWWEELAA